MNCGKISGSQIQILLIDDHEKNVIESKKLGFQAIQYHGDIEKLKTDLKEKGIKT